MVRSQCNGYHALLLLVAALPLLPHHADGATMFDLPHLDYATRLEDPLEQEELGSWGEDSAVMMTRNGFLPLNTRSRVVEQQQPEEEQEQEQEPSLTYLPERYLLAPPEDNYLRELLLHSPAGDAQQRAEGVAVGVIPPPPPPPPPPPHRYPSSSLFALPPPPSSPLSSRDLDQFGLSSSMDLKEWARPRLHPHLQDQLQLYMKQKRPSQQQQRYGGGGGLKVEQKRWWGGRHRGQMDRRASQSKHYDCLKSCIKEGRLHPIQCHTLC